MNEVLTREFIRRMANELPYFRKGIFPSEMFGFFTQTESFGSDDQIFECGTGYGSSTYYLGCLFPATKLTCIDSNKYRQLNNVLKRMSFHRHIEFILGDAHQLLALQLKSSKAKRKAVLIDGPKGQPAIELMNKIIDQVEFVAIHDLPRPLARDAYWSTHAADWHHNHLDQNVPAEYRRIYPRGPGLHFFRHDLIKVRNDKEDAQLVRQEPTQESI